MFSNRFVSDGDTYIITEFELEGNFLTPDETLFLPLSMTLNLSLQVVNLTRKRGIFDFDLEKYSKVMNL